MSSKPEIGELSLISSCKWTRNFEWRINIFPHTRQDTCFRSSLFSMEDSEWYFRIYPYGEAKNDSVGWISLYLMRGGDKSSPKCAIFSFGEKKACGSVQKFEENPMNWVFSDNSTGFGIPRLLKRSTLLKRKMTSSNALILTCSLTVMDIFEIYASPLDTRSKDFAELLNSKKGCDVTLKVQHREFQAHKVVLSARSPVFAAMFETEMMEKQTRIVDIVDCNSDAFSDFLTFLYSAEFRKDTNFNKVMELYKIANKYCVAELKAASGLYMMLFQTVENVCDMALLGEQFKDFSLIEKAKSFFNRNFRNVLETSSWKSLIKSNGDLANELLRYVVSENDL